MLELCFDMSTRGALRVAQHCGGGGIAARGFILGMAEGPTAAADHWAETVCCRAEERLREQEILRREAIPLGGNPGDVTLSLGLDMGDIREPLGEVRHQLQRQRYDGENEIADRDWGRNLEAAERLKACGPGDTIRIWADRTPHSACGLLHAASLLKDTKAAVHVVFLPLWRETGDGKTLVSYLGWGEVEPELFGHFLSREEPLPPLILRAMASRWRELQQENAPLRAVVNGQVRSVREDFYDEMIRRHIPEGQTKIANIIGDVLGREKPGIGDVWLAERIRWMLSAGELRMVREDPERFYRSVVERA